jgi:lipoprotein-releasing system ATP-binding protein
VAEPVVVALRAVRKSFNIGTPVETEVLHGIDLELHRGEFCAVMGPSGSGKSTLLNIIGLLDRPTSGTLSVCGEETTGLDDAALTRLRGHSIGFVFQYHHLLSAFSALENVVLPMLGAAGRPDAAMFARAERLLDEVGLSRWRDNPANRLSGGQQQRVAVARALAMNPPVLLADEPTGNLDTKSADAVFELLRKVNREEGTSVLFVTHNPELASRCDKTIQVVDGAIVGAREARGRSA